MLFEKKLLVDEELQLVEAAIGEAEKITSGEIRVAIKGSCRCDPLLEAQKTFHRLGMDKTAQKNGVLILIAVTQKKFAIVGDEGIDRFMGQEGWNSVRDILSSRFAQGRFAEGLVEAVHEVSRVLADHFPPVEGDRNELPNTVVEEH